jgi:DNA-3-methyladenine glycosylase
VKRLPLRFFARPSCEVAPDLIGKIFRVGSLEGRITEVEAYGGFDDAASHAFRGPTPRNEVMFGRAGVLYVYFTYGMHHCANIVTGADGVGQAVLIRAVEPLVGLDDMRARRPKARNDRELTNGPGKLCAAFALNRSHNGRDVTERSSAIGLFTDGHEASMVRATTRIGISKEIDRRWRWIVSPSE